MITAIHIAIAVFIFKDLVTITLSLFRASESNHLDVPKGISNISAISLCVYPSMAYRLKTSFCVFGKS
jgi:hypothetical protein